MIDTPEVEPLAAPWRARPSGAFVAEVVAEAGPRVGRPAIIAVDGRQGSGKTAIAARLAALTLGATVVHSDDVAWWEAFFDWEQLMITGVLEPLRRGEAVDFRPPAWEARGRPGSMVVPSGAPLVVLEGVGTSRRSLLPYIDGAIWVQSDLAESRRRGLERDGGKQSDIDLWDEWENEEQPFLAEERPWERATVIVCGTPRLTGIDFDESTEVLVARFESEGAMRPEECPPRAPQARPQASADTLPGMEIPAFGRRASALLALLAALSLVATGSGFSTAAAPTGSAGVVGPQLRFRTVRP